MTGDEYMALLLERQAAYESKHPSLAHPWARPLLEWFIRPGDEELFEPPVVEPQPKRTPSPRVYRSSTSLRAERDRLDAQRAPLLAPISPDVAASRGQALGSRRTGRLAQREDSRLRQYVALSKRIDYLDHRIRLADAREAKALRCDA